VVGGSSAAGSELARALPWRRLPSVRRACWAAVPDGVHELGGARYLTENRYIFCNTPSSMVALLLAVVVAARCTLMAGLVAAAAPGPERPDAVHVWQAYDDGSTSSSSSPAQQPVKKSDGTEAFSRDGIDVSLMAEFRAIGDPANDTLAIQRAIDLAAAGQGSGVVLLKKGQTFVTWPLKLSSNVRLVIDGTLATSGDPHQYCNTSPCKALLWAEKVSNLTVTSSKKGLGEIFGNGSAWWPLRRRSYKFWAPQIFSCKGCAGVHLSNFRVRDSPAWCLENSGEDLVIEDVTILAPATSPNTDGIGIMCTGGPGKPCVVRSCHVENGDDEVAVGGSNILVENSYFGLGHGASIGSLGFNGSTAHVQNVTFRNLFFNTTTSSIHIKTWQGGHGLVSNITCERQLEHTYLPVACSLLYTSISSRTC
jgi:polygalacturonase